MKTGCLIAAGVVVLLVLVLGGILMGRYNGLVAMFMADGHTDAQTPQALIDQRMWIDQADTKLYWHNP